MAESRPVVVTTFTILADMGREVAGDKAEVVSMIPAGADVHEYAPTPRDIIQTRRADLVVWNGLGLERWFERFYQGMSSVPSAVLSDGVTPILLGEGRYQGKPNPHAWMAPANAVIYVNNFRDALIDIDPTNRDAYTINAAQYVARIQAIDTTLKAQLARIPASQRYLATCEGAFSYLTTAYGFNELYLWAVNAEQEGSPQQVRHLVDAVRTKQVPVTFCESTVSDRAMRQVTRETGARYGGVLYVDSLTSAEGQVPTYLALLAHNARAMAAGFGVEQNEVTP
ncbi:metal ABC transporter substrate-binding protein [Larsenimonas rhizosphaerae]|uniref:Metal ABC transporter substrate-binding protein n=1 Tax=Larsenimonas rhizosphaerae TaxID=2944682 RepID=A0AA41ZDH9_9GAMM|nr:metal ABC transporter substrate-binding protein [Larsenimonas rhizosphaerae]MCX2523322.1 metal ABC transporter substrate-binding protein [Larsenimonas rhizosphaerae]